MIIDSSPQSQFKALGFTDYGVAAVPMLSPLPKDGKPIQTHVAGENLSVFKNSKNKAAAEQLVKFLTSEKEQVILNTKYLGQLPVVNSAYKDPAFQTDTIKLQEDTLKNHAAPMPLVPQEGQMETLVGGAVKNLIAQAATGHQVTTEEIKSALTDANTKMAAAN
jgi:multiple sugar transport system substrate-binding protein